jgi:hypothetical protein
MDKNRISTKLIAGFVTAAMLVGCAPATDTGDPSEGGQLSELPQTRKNALVLDLSANGSACLVQGGVQVATVNDPAQATYPVPDLSGVGKISVTSLCNQAQSDGVLTALADTGSERTAMAHPTVGSMAGADMGGLPELPGGSDIEPQPLPALAVVAGYAALCVASVAGKAAIDQFLCNAFRDRNSWVHHVISLGIEVVLIRLSAVGGLCVLGWEAGKIVTDFFTNASYRELTCGFQG